MRTDKSTKPKEKKHETKQPNIKTKIFIIGVVWLGVWNEFVFQ